MCTTQALIVGVHDPAYSSGATFGKVNTDIGRVADYMMEVRRQRFPRFSLRCSRLQLLHYVAYLTFLSSGPIPPRFRLTERLLNHLSWSQTSSIRPRSHLHPTRTPLTHIVSCLRTVTAPITYIPLRSYAQHRLALLADGSPVVPMSEKPR
jgi:hypothetical protein